MSVMVWGHRGHRHHRANGIQEITGPSWHENTIGAYRQVLDKTMGVECDIVQSRQNTPFLIHDTLFNGMVKYELQNHLAETSKAAVQDRFIFQMNDDEIAALKLRDGQEIPKLKNFLRLLSDYPDRFANLELKGPHVADPALDVVEQAIHHKLIKPSQVIFSSFNLPALRSLRMNNGSRFQIGISFMVADQPMTQMYPNWPLAEQNAYYVPFSIDALQRPDIIDINPEFFNLEYRSLDTDSIEAIHHFFPRAKIILWYSGEPYPSVYSPLADAVETYMASDKIFAVITDYPLATQAILQERGIEVITPSVRRLAARSQ